MDQSKAVAAFSALAQETRVEIFRLLVREKANSLRASEISNRLEIVPSTLSGHLAILKRAGLLNSKRHQREIHYAADVGAVNALIGFLLQDCCDGQIENCAAILTLLHTDPNDISTR